MDRQLVLTLVFAVAVAIATDTPANAPVSETINNDHLLSQLQAWQQALASPSVFQPRYTSNNNWQQPAPTGEIPSRPHFPNNPYINPSQPAVTAPPVPAYNPPQSGYNPNPNPPKTSYVPAPPTNNYVPHPPVTGGHYRPKPVPVSPQIEALRKYCLKPRGQFPSKRCNSYINCWDDMIVEQECPAGLMFSEAGYCDYAFNVDCSSRPISKPTPKPPMGHKCPSPLGTYRSATNCSVFYVCVHGIPYKQECSQELYYNPILGVCDYKYNVECEIPEHSHIPVYTGTTPVPQEVYFPPYYTRLPADMAEAGKVCIPGSVARLRDDCSVVSVCRKDGRTEIVNCGDGTAYDITTDKCVAPHLARC